jgi:hypothetical protein
VARPYWLEYGLALVMVSVSLYCTGRLLVAKRWERRNHYDVNVSHILMGMAMAGMLVPRWNLVPNETWLATFGIVAICFLAMSTRFAVKRGLGGTDDDRAHHVSHYLIHMVMACAMLYMYWERSPAGEPSAQAMTVSSAIGAQPDYAGLSLIFIVILLASAIWQLDAIGKLSARQLVLNGGAGTGHASVHHPYLAPRLEVACHISMCIAMGYMLVLTL